MSTASDAQGRSFRAYLRDLERDGKGASAFVDGDASKEISYLRAGAYRFEAVLDMLPEGREGRAILDVGATPFTMYLRQRETGAQVWALDKTEHLRERFEAAGLRFAVCDLNEDPLPLGDGSVDVAIFTEVIEHLFRPPGEILGEMRRVVRPGGALIISAPNIAALKKRVWLAMGKTPLQDPDQAMRRGWMHGYGHIHEYTRAELVRVLRRAGWEIDRTRYINYRARDALSQDGVAPFRRVLKSGYCALTRLFPPFSSAIMVRAIRPDEG